MSRMVVVSRVRQEIDPAGANLFGPWEEINDFGWNDGGLAEMYARGHAKDRLYRQKAPWFEEISVCPKLVGLGRGGSDYLDLDNKSVTYTIGIE